MRSLIITASTVLVWQRHATATAPPDLKYLAMDGCHEQYNFHNGTTRVTAMGGTDVAAVRCCKKSSPSLVAADICETDVNGLCNSGKTYAEAKQICESATTQGGGWSLCTITELQSGICCGTGCDYDYMTNVWTKTPATPRFMRSVCDPTASSVSNYTLATSTALAIALCTKNNGASWQKCHSNTMGYDNAVSCCTNLANGPWVLPESDMFSSVSQSCPGPGGVTGGYVWIATPGYPHGPYVATDGCKIRNYGSLARSAGGKDYYYNTFEKHAVRCCDYDGGSCTTATRLGCESAVDWYEAHEACHEMGKRLCSLAEMDDDKCCVTGCMFDVDKVWTSTTTAVYRYHQKNETGDSCNYKSDVSSGSTTPVGVVCCGPDSKCVDPVSGTCTKLTPVAAQQKCAEIGLEVCRDSRLCSRCKSTKCYTDGEFIIGTKSYVSR